MMIVQAVLAAYANEKGMDLNPDIAYTNLILNGIEKKDGFCPCKPGKQPENKCPCVDFKVHTKCECRLFI